MYKIFGLTKMLCLIYLSIAFLFGCNSNITNVKNERIFHSIIFNVNSNIQQEKNYIIQNNSKHISKVVFNENFIYTNEREKHKIIKCTTFIFFNLIWKYILKPIIERIKEIFRI